MMLKWNKHVTVSCTCLCDANLKQQQQKSSKFIVSVETILFQYSLLFEAF